MAGTQLGVSGSGLDSGGITRSSINCMSNRVLLGALLAHRGMEPSAKVDWQAYGSANAGMTRVPNNSRDRMILSWGTPPASMNVITFLMPHTSRNS